MNVNTITGYLLLYNELCSRKYVYSVQQYHIRGLQVGVKASAGAVMPVLQKVKRALTARARPNRRCVTTELFLEPVSPAAYSSNLLRTLFCIAEPRPELLQ